MSKTVWHSGPPPSVGWWPASFWADSKSLRWWDGEVWSVSTEPTATSKEAGEKARQKTKGQFMIRWAKRWWV